MENKARIINDICEFCGMRTTEKGTEKCAYNHVAPNVSNEPHHENPQATAPALNSDPAPITDEQADKAAGEATMDDVVNALTDNNETDPFIEKAVLSLDPQNAPYAQSEGGDENCSEPQGDQREVVGDSSAGADAATEYGEGNTVGENGVSETVL